MFLEGLFYNTIINIFIYLSIPVTLLTTARCRRNRAYTLYSQFIKRLINNETNAFSPSLSGITSRMDGTERWRWRGMLCAVTSGQTRFACHWVSQGHSTVPYEPTPRRESPSWNQASVSGLPSSLGSRPLEKLDQKGKHLLAILSHEIEKISRNDSICDEIQKTSGDIVLEEKYDFKSTRIIWIETCNNVTFFFK